MKKNVFHWMLTAAVVCGLGMSFTSCKDDDDENGTEQRSDIDPLDTDDAHVAWRWLCALTDAGPMDKNWASKSYTVTAGQASSQNELVRIFVVKDLEEAQEDFSRLAAMDPSALSVKQTVNGGAAGTMTWTPSAEGEKNLAEVTVNSRILPGLQKIVYCTEAQVGDNGILWDSMKGTAYYNFGDVIQDPDGYYWVCVRPAHYPDNTKSYWMNIYNTMRSGGQKTMLAENVYDEYNNVKKYNFQTIKLPTKLAYDRKHIYNLSNLVWAILNPDQYVDVCLSNKDAGLGGFDTKYYARNFLENVAAFWSEKSDDNYTIWEKLFAHSLEDMRKVKKMQFIYNGYHWWWGNTPDMYFYTSTGYKEKYKGSESDDKVTDIDVVTNGFDITRYACDPNSKLVGFSQFDEDPTDHKVTGTWVIRYKSGEQLCTAGSYSPYSEIRAKSGQFKEIYRFHKRLDIAAGENVPPIEDANIKKTDMKDGQFQGVPHYKIGDVYQDNKGHKWFVLDMAGNRFNTADPCSDYSYLVSFDAVTTNGARATNLPSRDEAIKVMVWLDMITQTNKRLTGVTAKSSHRQRFFWNIVTKANADLRYMLTFAAPVSGLPAETQATSHATVAYRSYDGTQHLMRFMNERENVTSNRMNCFKFWEHYYDPKTKTFTDEIIRLADINDSQKIAKYADDEYSRQALAFPNFESVPLVRQPRTTVDARATQASNYVYRNGAFATDACSMWNDHVLMFAVTRVFDHGEDNYSKTSEDAIELTESGLVGYDVDDDDDDFNTDAGLMNEWGGSLVESYKSVFIDGVPFTVPTWKKL